MYKFFDKSRTLVLFVIAGLVLSPLNAAAQNTVVKNINQGIPVRDVTLTPTGNLQGTITNVAGKAEAKVPVEIRQRGQVVSQAVTDARGHFVAHGLSAGSYDFQTAAGQKPIRLWHASAAPPHATPNLEVNDYQLIRGQYLGALHPQHISTGVGQENCCGRPFEGAFRGGAPLLFGLGLAAAIALPIALSDDDNGTRVDDVGGDNEDAS